ncbi:MAG: hypothetical protein WB565_00100 [Acidimicrobiales bacterium]
MPVARGIVRAGGGDAVASEVLGDGVEAVPSQVVVKDPLHHRARHRVDLELVESLADCGLSGVRMRASVAEPVAIGRTTTEEATLDLRLRSHRRSHPYLDPVPFALRHAAVKAHHEIVGVAARVDLATDLGHPQLDPVVDEHREGQTELVAVERARWLTDHDGIEAPLRTLESVKKCQRLRPALPRK